MKKKYELIPSDKEGFFRIKSLRDFADVKKGDVGGYVESQNNLSHEGDCWIYDDAMVYENARVSNNAVVECNAQVYGNARVFGNAHIYDRAKVYGKVYVGESVYISAFAKVHGDACIGESACITGHAEVYGNTTILGKALICDKAKVFGCAWVTFGSIISGNAKVSGSYITGLSVLTGDCKVESDGDYIVFKNWWSSGRYFTWTRSNNKWSVGCFYGTGEELIKKAYKDSEKSGKCYEKYVKLVEDFMKES